MAKHAMLGIRAFKTEVAAVKRYARAQGQTMSELIRARVVTPALSFDPRQMELLTQEKEHPRRAG